MTTATATRPFTHLHVHSHYTLLGGTASVADLAARAVAEGMAHLALTDTNALYGAVAFARACRASGVQPVVGMAVTVAPPEDLGAQARDTLAAPGRLVLLANGPAGYRSLCRLSSLVQGSPERESLAARGLAWDDLAAHRAGLICLSGGRRGWTERLLRAGNGGAARRYAGRLAGIYDENTYLALEMHRPADLPVVEQVLDLGRRLGLPGVAVQPVYCLDRRDAPRLRLLAAIDRNCSLEELPPAALPCGGDPEVDLHWLGADEVAARFERFPGTVLLAGEIAARCAPAMPDGRPIWPVLQLPDGQTPDAALAALARQGLSDRYPPEPTPAANERLESELSAIARHGYAPLFLIVADVVRFARQTGIPVSTRGSVANSLVAFATGITSVDPMAHGLIFERFLSPARADAPDIDLDFCSRRRDEVLDYVRRTYGAERVALVSTLSTMRPRLAVRETAKAYGLDEDSVGRLVAHFPSHWHPDPRRRDGRSVDEIVAEIDDPRLEEIVRAAYGLLRQPHHLGVHPGGVVIAPGALTDVLPVQWSPKGFQVTQFDHHDVEALGLPKIDLLGIRALTVLSDAVAWVRRFHDPAFDLSAIPLDDPQTGDLLAGGETVGVFQCESDGARRTLRQLRARSVRDLAIANAFFKPGPSTGGMARTFVRRYRGEEPVSFLHPALEAILGPTQGVLIFQEQILRVAREIAGLSWAEADHLRRGMSKFRPDEMERIRERFVDGCRRPAPDGAGLTPQQAETLWEQVAAFAGYGFNQGHATAYADVSYRSAYLKAHWPAAFLCARLADWGGFHHPAIYMAEAVRLGLCVRPPHVNYSDAKFSLSWDLPGGPAGQARGVLWMGLGQVRDLRQASVEAITAGRRQRPFSGLRDLLERVPLQAKEIAHLVQCGALDGLGESRAGLLAEAEGLQRAGNALQMAFDFARPAVQGESPAERLHWEWHLLGQPVSVHPLELLTGRLPEHVPLCRLSERPGRPVTVLGVRLPGWTGGRGFFLGDGDSFIVVKHEVRHEAGTSTPAKASPPWRPLLLHGRWSSDEWGTWWFQAESVRTL